MTQKKSFAALCVWFPSFQLMVPLRELRGLNMSKGVSMPCLRQLGKLHKDTSLRHRLDVHRSTCLHQCMSRVVVAAGYTVCGRKTSAKRITERLAVGFRRPWRWPVALVKWWLDSGKRKAERAVLETGMVSISVPR